MKIRYIPFESWHLKLFKEGSNYAAPSLYPDVRSAMYRGVIGLTILVDDQVAGIIGIAPMWNGVYEATFIPSDLMYKYVKTLIKDLKWIIETTIQGFNIHRLQATHLTEHPTHGRFLQAVGFTHDGSLPKYGPTGEDFELYSITKD